MAGGTENMWTLVVEIYSALRKKHHISSHHYILHKINDYTLKIDPQPSESSCKAGLLLY